MDIHPLITEKPISVMLSLKLEQRYEELIKAIIDYFEEEEDINNADSKESL